MKFNFLFILLIVVLIGGCAVDEIYVEEEIVEEDIIQVVEEEEFSSDSEKLGFDELRKSSFDYEKLALLGLEEDRDVYISTKEKDYSIRFGINGGLYGDERREEQISDLKDELDELDSVWLRHIGRAGWWEMEVEPGVWDWTLTDQIVLNDDNPWVLELFGSSGTVYPFGGFSEEEFDEIISTKDTKEVFDYIIDNSLDLNDPQQLLDAENYVKTYVTRYKDQIKYWEVSNEGINTPQREELIRYCYQWVKEVHPEAQVIITGIAGTTDEQFNGGVDTLDDMLANGLGDYFDIANFHYYAMIEDDFELQLERTYDRHQAVFDKHGVDKPVWVTETSTSSAVDSELSGPSSEGIQAQHVVKRLVIFSAKGAEKVFWHSYGSTSETNKFYQCNMVDPDTRDPKPAYYTFKLILDKIGYFDGVETLETEDFRLYKFVNPDGSVVYVAWSIEEKSVDLSDYIAGDVTVTHIVENRENVVPRVEIIDSSSVDLDFSPVFIE